MWFFARQSEGKYERAKWISDGVFGFGTEKKLVAKICSSNSETTFLVLTSTNDNETNAVTADQATWIRKQAIADNFRPSDIEIVGKNESRIVGMESVGLGRIGRCLLRQVNSVNVSW